jgi:hypothetical protein
MSIICHLRVTSAAIRCLGAALAALLLMPAIAGAAAAIKGNFDGDGRADLLLQNSGTQQLSIWLMNGAAVGCGHCAE